MARTTSAGDSDDSSVVHWLKNAALTGIALIIPLVVTVLVLVFVWGFIASLVNPLSTALGEAFGLTTQAEQYVLLGLTTVGLAIVVVLLGVVANATSRTGIEAAFDHTIEAIPGIGGIYSTFNEMSELLLDTDSQSFQEVVLVEYPNEDTFCVAFLTTDTPEFVMDAAGKEEMITVFMPMGPNPFMGGFILHISDERVHEVDMTVEEGIQSIVTSGAALGEHEAAKQAHHDDATAIEHGSPGVADSGGTDAAILDEDSATRADAEEGA